MKKLIAILLILVMAAGGCAAAFAETHAVLYWNEELQHWEIQVIDDGPGYEMNPNPTCRDAFPDGVNPFEKIDFRPMGDEGEPLEDFIPW